MSEDEPRVAGHENRRNGDPIGGSQKQQLSGGVKHDWRAGLVFVLAVYAASRMLYLISGSLLASVVPVGGFVRTTPDLPFGTLNIWAHWDGVWYTQIAGEGYGASAPASTAFFPLYPLLMRSFAELFGGPLSKEALSVWGPLLSLLFLPFALYFLYHIALQGWGQRVAEGSVLTISLFPTSFFLNAAYTESLFLALSCGSIWAMRVRKDLLLACVVGAFAAATRNVGMFLVVAIMYEWVRAGGLQGGRRRVVEGIATLSLVPGGLLVYMGYLWLRFGDPLLFYSAQKNWGRQATGPLATAGRAWESAAEGSGRLIGPGLWAHPSLGNLADHLSAANNLYNLAFFVFAVVVLLAGLRELPLSLSIYGLLLVAPATLFGTPESPLMGTPRYVLVAFPIFIVLGLLSGRKLLFGGWLLLSTILSVALCGLFVSWRFVA